MERGLPDDGLKQPIREIVHELVAGNYEALEANGRTELTAKDLRAAVASHGVTLVDVPGRGVRQRLYVRRSWVAQPRGSAVLGRGGTE